MTKLPELLAPAGTLDAFKTAILYGADAIYAGLPGFSMRARAKITVDEVKQGIELAHAAGKKVYLAFNLFVIFAKQVSRSGIFIIYFRQHFVKYYLIIYSQPGCQSPVLRQSEAIASSQVIFLVIT